MSNEELPRGTNMCEGKADGVEVRAMIDMGATTNLVEANLVPHFGLHVARANLAVGLTSHHQVVPNDVTVANMRVRTWVRDTSFMVMAMSRYDVILRMKFLYNTEVHVHLHLSCI